MPLEVNRKNAMYASLALAASSIVLRKVFGNGGIAKSTVLEMDLRKGQVVEDIDPVSKALYKNEKIPFRDLLKTLQLAATDKRISGIVILLDVHLIIGLAQLQELHQAILRFRERSPSKKVIGFAETFFETTHSPIAAYYLASACTAVYTPPYAGMMLVSHWACSPFVKHSLEKLGIDPNIERRKDYKTMADFFQEDHFTPAAKEMMTDIFESAFGSAYADMAAARGLTVEAFVEALRDGPLFPSDVAVRLKLVDGLVGRTDLYERVIPDLFGGSGTGGLLGRFGKKDKKKAVPLLWSHLYLAKAKAPAQRKGPVVALITAEGGIHRGKSATILNGGPSIGSDTLSQAIREARKDKAVKAILLRVNSGGGSAVASDVVLTEVIKAREEGKKVVVSMGNVAASGGYFISLAADRIVASPTTITGSIGVVNGKFVVTRFWEKLGVTFDCTDHAENATILSSLKPYSSANRAKVAAATDWIYDDFKGKVARWRGFDDAHAEAAAQGRVFTGARAKELRLVDELGGLQRAVEVTKELIGVPPGDEGKVRLQEFPKRLSLVQLLMVKPAKSSEEFRPFGELAAGTPALASLMVWYHRIAQACAVMRHPAAAAPVRAVAAALQAEAIQLTSPLAAQDLQL